MKSKLKLTKTTIINLDISEQKKVLGQGVTQFNCSVMHCEDSLGAACDFTRIECYKTVENTCICKRK